MHNNLLEIIEKKKEDLLQQMKKVSLEEIRKKIIISQEENVFLKNIVGAKDVALIAEIKFASPTNPSLGSQSDLLDRAKTYENAGADAISLITESHFFKGDIAFVSQIKNKIGIPVLQKDFVIDAYQIYEAKNAGSEALLLIARLLDTEELKQFVLLCQNIHIEPVVEINNEEDLKKAIATNTKIIAVNARNLETFAINVASACELMNKIPDTFIKLGFSGIHSANEVEQYKQAGAKGVLVGTSLMKTKNIGGFISSLRGGTTKQSQTRSPRFARDDNSVLVKICGVRNLESAKTAIIAGADFIGFNFVPTSKRFIDLKKAQEIIDELRIKNHGSRIKFVGVFQNQDIETVNEIAELLELDFVQLHGEEDEEYMRKIKTKIIKKYNSNSFTDLNESVEYVLLDREVQGKGEMIDLEKAAKINNIFPIFFSGGLTPENVSQVVRKVKPFAVDVAGGIETNGKEDVEKIKMFITNAKGVTV